MKVRLYSCSDGHFIFKRISIQFQIEPRRDQRVPSLEEIVLKREGELELAHQTIKDLNSQMGTVRVSSSESDDILSMGSDEAKVEAEVEQKDSFFAHEHSFKTNVNGDRYYFDGKIKIKKHVVQTLKNMNSSLITNTPDHDYRFIFYLLSEVFSNETLAQSAVYQSTSGNRKFHELDEELFSFVRDVFKERTGNDKNRFHELSKHVNKRCTILRQNLKKKK